MKLKSILLQILYRFKLVSLHDIYRDRFYNYVRSNNLSLLDEKDRIILQGLSLLKDGIGRNNKIILRKNNSDVGVFNQVIINQEYKLLVDIVGLLNIKIENIIDAGANIGLTTLYLASSYPDAKIICIEPSKENAEIISLNIINNNLKNVKIDQNGVWYKEAYLKIDTNFRDGMAWSLQVEESSIPTSLKGKSIMSIANENNIDVLDILKIDIEGAEKYLFSSNQIAADFLLRTKILCIEIHEEAISKKKIYNILKKNGFTFMDSTEFTIAVNHNLV